ncbi:radical SAM protein [Nostoc punctiforme]|uniref:Radical SAM domain protein n=1 Tax=Nostoc punctiforme (strain ATCC 29133 / PCC 73102) TaxID=63737 RepID=B2JB94_NOSP7|nr:radical SAM protein [Nostoc punctiforme]ACC85198.1 Radical SAM domain protein [Nostoc punctiforme PCC 73102]
MTVTILHEANSIDTDYVKRARLISDKFLELIILPTEQCNFRCTYCYEDFSIGRMQPETIAGIKAILDKRCPNLSYLNLAWFGGEPLVAKNIVLDISEYALSLVSKYPHLHYSSNMTTNGYLLDLNTASALANVGVTKYQISLDGPREIHNQSRIRADGKSTFERIWTNLLAIRDSSLPIYINLRLHFTIDTVKLIDPLLEDIKREFLPDSRFSVYFKSIERLGGTNDASIKIYSESEKNTAIKTLEAKLFGEKLQSPQNATLPDDYVCYASRPNSLVIRANGSVGKCTVALSDERNNIGTLRTDGRLDLIPGRFAPWVRGIQTLDPDVLGCPLVSLPTSDEIATNLQTKALAV